MTKQPKSPLSTLQKHAARLVAAQALYSVDITKTEKSPQKLVQEFTAIFQEVEDNSSESIIPNQSFLLQLIHGVQTHIEEIDPLLSTYLQEGWKIERLPAINRAVLRLAIFELLKLTEIPFKTVIDEYVTIAQSFLDDDKETGFINSVLDKIGRDVRNKS